MKVAFSTSGDTLDGPLDSRFGRAPRFLLYDLDTGSVEVIDNTQNLNAPQGAGVQAAQTVTRSGASSVVTGHCGPKAFRVLGTAGVKVYPCDAATIREALASLQGGKLTAADGANVEGHWV